MALYNHHNSIRAAIGQNKQTFMAKHLDLEEQEQLDELKHFWKQYGDLITWALIVVFGAVAVWNGYHYWQSRQASQAAVLYDEVERAVQSGDTARLDRIAKLRLAGMLMETKAYDEALKLVSGSFPKDFAALAADRRGDILVAQGKKNEAKAEYEKAYKGLDERAEYRRLVEIKLNALGVDPAATSNVAAAATDAGVKK